MLYTFIYYTQKLKTILSKHCLGMDTFRSIHDTHRWFNLRSYLHVMEVGENELCYWSSQNQLSGGNTKTHNKHQPSELTAVVQYFNNPTKSLHSYHMISKSQSSHFQAFATLLMTKHFEQNFKSSASSATLWILTTKVLTSFSWIFSQGFAKEGLSVSGVIINLFAISRHSFNVMIAHSGMSNPNLIYIMWFPDI